MFIIQQFSQFILLDDKRTTECECSKTALQMRILNEISYTFFTAQAFRDHHLFASLLNLETTMTIMGRSMVATGKDTKGFHQKGYPSKMNS